MHRPDARITRESCQGAVSRETGAGAPGAQGEDGAEPGVRTGIFMGQLSAGMPQSQVSGRGAASRRNPGSDPARIASSRTTTWSIRRTVDSPHD